MPAHTGVRWLCITVGAAFQVRGRLNRTAGFEFGVVHAGHCPRVCGASQHTCRGNDAADGCAAPREALFMPMKIRRGQQASGCMSFMEAVAQGCVKHPSAPVAAMTAPTPDARILAEVSAKAMGSTSVTSPPSTWVTFGSGALPTCRCAVAVSTSQHSERGAMVSDTGVAQVLDIMRKRWRKIWPQCPTEAVPNPLQSTLLKGPARRS